MKLLPGLTIFVAILTLALYAGSVQGAEYVLKKTGLKAGHTLHMEATQVVTDATLVMRHQGQTSKGGRINTDNRKVQVTRITAVSDEEVTAAETEIKEFTLKQAVAIFGTTKNDDKTDPLHGLTVLSRKVDGKWINQLKAGEASAEQTKALAKLKFFESDDFYEDRPVTVGQSWNVPPEKVSKLLALADKIEGTVQCKFERIEAFNGHQCAVIAVEFKVSGKVPDQPDTTMAMDMKGTIHRVLDLKFDAKVVLAGTVKVDGPIPTAPNAKREASGPMSITQTATLVK